MNTLVLSNLLLNTAAIATLAVVMALAYCQPNRRRPREWVAAETQATASPPVSVQEELAQAA